MTSDLVLLAVGVALLVKGGDLFVSAAVRIAGFLRLPNVVIGSTLVSLATTTPEMVVAIVAATRGNADLALGNSVGSTICNIGLILGLSATLRPIYLHPKSLRTAVLTMVGLGGALVLLTLDLSLERGEGVLLILAGVGYFAYDFMAAAREPKPVEIAEAKAITQEMTRPAAWLATRAGTATQFTFAAGLVILSSRIVVDSAVGLAAAWGVPPLVIGLTVVALATSLPELATAVSSARRGVSDLSVGNIVGANIANLSLIVGAAAAIAPVTVDKVTQRFDFPAMLVLMAALGWSLWTRSRLSRLEGGVLLLTYAGYIGMVIVLALSGSRPDLS
jgi:cation:H+ antiporter